MKKALRPIVAGERYGDLTIIGPAPSRRDEGSTKCTGRRVVVRCACGVVKDVRHAVLLAGRVKSCGCGRKYTPLAPRVRAEVVELAPKARAVDSLPYDSTLIGRLHLLVHPDDEGKVPWAGDPITVPELATMLGTDVKDLELRGGIFAPWLEMIIVGGHTPIVYGRHVTTSEQVEAARARLLSKPRKLRKVADIVDTFERSEAA